MWADEMLTVQKEYALKNNVPTSEVGEDPLKCLAFMKSMVWTYPQGGDCVVYCNVKILKCKMLNYKKHSHVSQDILFQVFNFSSAKFLIYLTKQREMLSGTHI